MLKVLSVSLGSSSRNHEATTELLNKQISVQRVGVDGSMQKAMELLKQINGNIDAVGLGGIDLYLVANNKKYIVKDAQKLKNCVTKTPLVDGSGLKNTLERAAILYLQEKNIIDFKNAKVLLVSAVDRFGMAETLHELGADMFFGDLIFGLNIPIPIRKMSTFRKLAKALLPIVVKMPFKMLYPTGSKQEKKSNGKYVKHYRWADIVAGDYHFIKKYMPDSLPGKTIITNTITEKDFIQLKEKGIKMLVTTTPNIKGRSFGTNVLEAMFVAVLDKPFSKITEDDYMNILKKINYKPRIETLNE